MGPLRRLIDDFLDPGLDDAAAEKYRHLLAGVSRLLEVTSVLAAEIDPTRILETITSEARTALHCERASVFQYDATRNELYSSVVTDLEIREIRQGLDRGIVGYVARNRQLLCVADPANDPRWNPGIDAQTGFTTRNILAAPLVAPHDGSLLGVLQLLNREGRAFDEVDEELLTAFSDHAAVALDRARLVEELRRRQKLQASFDLARQIQRDFMPSKLPKVLHYEVATWWRSAEAVGGDYCDVIPLKDGRVGLAVADVSGHGLGPSLIMASLRAALHAMVLEHSAPEVLLNLLGRSLKCDLRDGRFITMVLAVLDPRDHSLEYANAGHAPALRLEAATGEFACLESTGMPLGVLDRPEYPQGWPIELEPGDLLVLGTDGIVEAMDSRGKQFGQHRLEALVRQSARRPVKELVERIGSEVESHFAGDLPQDDLTILAVRRNR